MYCAQSFTTVPLCHSSQLFGEDDPDEDVSPDTADPELTGTDKYKLVLQYSLIFLGGGGAGFDSLDVTCCPVSCILLNCK